MLRLWIRDNVHGNVHEYGTNNHDSLILQDDGSLHYYNLQTGCGTMFPEEGYSFCNEDGSDIVGEMYTEPYVDIGGVMPENHIAESSNMVDQISRQATLDAFDGEIIITGSANAEAVFGYVNLVCDRIKRLPSEQPTDVQEAYYRGKIDGIKECMKRVEKVNKEFANE